MFVPQDYGPDFQSNGWAPPELPDGPISGDPLFDRLVRWTAGGALFGGLLGGGSAFLRGR